MSEPVKKPNQAPESYLPKDMPEIMRLAAEGAAKRPIAYDIRFKGGVPDSFETGRLVIRHFKRGDWRDLQEIAVSNDRSEFADCDHTWPTDGRGIKKACKWFVKGKQFWAVEVKAPSKVVCFVNFNGFNDLNEMNIGHVMNGAYFGNDYEYEALAALYDYCFAYDRPAAITAGWAMDDKVKLEPLVKLGTELASTGMHKAFRADSEGFTREFEGCRAIITREAWDQANPTSYIPKDIP